MIGQERSQNDLRKLPDLKVLTAVLIKSCSDMEIKDHENKNKQELFSSNLSIDNMSCEDVKKGSHLYTNDHAFVLDMEEDNYVRAA
ncbi:hypothetical protein CEXT_624731 [Caerostris extrusa]|uniref:Uncharacterized protein n=1 Tax=Caerostris extrusa TaxID=172846 RepID=A0AAV4TQ62_CAEEX|nr:hypothetical protein CEXT_624731 [Caerostris extrusa]